MRVAPGSSLSFPSSLSLRGDPLLPSLSRKPRAFPRRHTLGATAFTVYSSLPLKSQELQEPDPADDTFRNSTQTSSRNQQIWRCGRAWKGLIQRPKRAFSPHLSHFPHPPFGLYMTGVSSCAGNAIPRQLHLYSYPVGQKGLMLPL